MPDVDLTKSEQPDELIQLAWNGGLDKKAVLREGIDAAGLLLASERNNIATLFWPVPRPLEAVDVWSENTHAAPPLAEKIRPYTSAVAPGCVLGMLITQLFVMPRMSQNSALDVLVLIILAWIGVLGIVFKGLIEAAVRRRVARLDDNSALAIVLAQLRRGMTANPGLVPRACVWIRRGLAAPTS